MTGYAGAAGAGMAIGGQIYSAIEAQRIGKYNARVARANAQQDAFNAINEARQQERLASMIGDEIALVDEVAAFEQARLDEQLEKQEGRARAIIGASGLAFRGSPIAVLEENARQGQIQKLTLQFQAKLQKRALTEEQTQRLYQAKLLRFGAGERIKLGSQQAGLIRAEAQDKTVGSLLGAASTGLKAYSLFSKPTGGKITRASSTAINSGYAGEGM